MEVLRRPKNAKERALLQRNTSANRKWLYDPNCPNHCDKGIVEVNNYPPDDPFYGKLKSSAECECVYKETA